MPEPEDRPDEQPDERPDERAGERAGERPAAEPTGRERLRAAFRSPGRGQVVVAVLLAAVGFGAVTQVNATEEDDSYTGYRQQDLIDVLSGLAGASERARSEIARLEESRSDLLDRSESRRSALEQAQEESDTLAILAGLVPVRGPGVRIEIDGTVSIDSMLDLVQELRSAGAEALEVNDRVRLVAQSSFEATEAGLVVDGELLGPPYVLEAIGEPSGLRGALSFPGGPEDSLEDDGATIVVEQLESVEVDSVVDDAAPDVAVGVD